MSRRVIAPLNCFSRIFPRGGTARNGRIQRTILAVTKPPMLRLVRNQISLYPGAASKKHFHGTMSKFTFATEYKLRRDCASFGQGILYLANKAADCQNVTVIGKVFRSVKARPKMHTTTPQNTPNQIRYGKNPAKTDRGHTSQDPSYER